MKYLFFILLSISSSAEEKSVKNMAVGRFQIIKATNTNDPYLLDTETGRIWKPACAALPVLGQCPYTLWTQESIVDISVSVEEASKKMEHFQKTSKEK